MGKYQTKTMHLTYDVKDFREHSEYEVPLPEQALIDTLLSCGVDLAEHPVHLRIRVKDAHMGHILSGALSKVEPVYDEAEQEVEGQFRCNLYLPAGNPPHIPYLKMLNGAVRHGFTHLAQYLDGRYDDALTDEAIAALEQEAEAHTHHGICNILSPFAYGVPKSKD